MVFSVYEIDPRAQDSIGELFLQSVFLMKEKWIHFFEKGKFSLLLKSRHQGPFEIEYLAYEIVYFMT